MEWFTPPPDPPARPLFARCNSLEPDGHHVRLFIDGVDRTYARAHAVTRGELLSLRRQIAAVAEQISEAQALVQRLMTERSVLEAEARGYECAARRRRREARRKKP